MIITTKLSSVFQDAVKYSVPSFEDVGMPVCNDNGKTIGKITNIDPEHDLLTMSITDEKAIKDILMDKLCSCTLYGDPEAEAPIGMTK